MKLRQFCLLTISVIVLSYTSSVGFGQSVDAPGLTTTTSQTMPIVVDGNVKLIHELEIAAQADGIIREIYADEGHTVQQGATILKIDSRLEEANVSVAKQELLAAQEQAEQTADIEYAEASYKLAKAEHERIRTLVRKNAASASEKERAELEEERSRLAIKAATVKHNQDLMAAQVAEEKLKAAEVRLELYDVLAPMEGIITERIRDTGEWARAGEPIMKMVHMNEMKVSALIGVTGIPVSDLLGSKMVVKIAVNHPNLPFAEYDAKVDYVSPVLEADYVEVWTRVQNQRIAPNGPWILRDGMDANVEIHIGR